MLIINNLNKFYNSKFESQIGGVQGISFNVTEGEFFTLLGPSGCGKTTTLRCIAGLENPSTGQITLNGYELFNSDTGINIASNKRNMGMVFQSYAVWPHLTVLQNTTFPLRMSRTKAFTSADQKSKALQMLETVGLSEFTNRSASQLSGGQQQRLSLARALVAEPRLLLLDEPLSNLDAVLRDLMRVELRRLQKDLGVTAIYVTHDQSEALALSDRIAIMKNGKIIQIGNPKEIYKLPSSKFIATFIGHSNLIEGNITSKVDLDNIICVDSIVGKLKGLTNVNESLSESVYAMIRPEHIFLEKCKKFDDLLPENTFRGVLKTIIYLGEITEYRVQINNEKILVIRSSDELDLSVNDVVIVNFENKNCLIINR
jgi:iron(III) transport system ATP-binding protein